jgi:transcription-repair coupling factor (superfamily II helicase)
MRGSFSIPRSTNDARRGSSRSRRPGKTPAEGFASDALRIGDLVVHSEHGIGQVRALELLDQNSAAHECLSLAYAGDQKTLVPAEEIGELWRYGSADADIALDRLSGDAWSGRASWKSMPRWKRPRAPW